MDARFRSTAVALFAASLILFGACDCGGEEPGGTDPDCSEGERRCDEDGRIEVCGGGVFQVLGACPTGTSCREGECETDSTCVPACEGRVCGGDGCGDYCGACEVGEVCNTSGSCVEVPETCGNDVCDPGEDCAVCPEDCGACCGDSLCDPAQGETCWTCPADCGACCGDGTCSPDHGESCLTCPADCGCPADTVCDPDTETCVCLPDCAGRQCGPDGCGDTCGSCDASETCNETTGQCIDESCQPSCTGRECGTDGCLGSCGSCDQGHVCAASGQCVEESCQPLCDGRVCGDDGCGALCGTCPGGFTCNVSGQCVEVASGCECTGDQVCVDGRCREPDVLCSETNPTGLCESGSACVEGVCVSEGAGCSASNPAGICPMGEWCDGGTCVAIDDEILCDDENPCTFDWYDGARNRCVHEADDGALCSDGNGCTTNWCDDGVCMAQQIGGCIEPPVIDPYITPTNVGSLALSGTKPAGSSIEINGSTAVSENPEAVWSINLDLVPGDNVYSVRSRQGGTASEVVEVRIVYDITPPLTTVTPGGGIFRTGVTVQVTTNEPATVYYTTDASLPNEWSPSFQSVRTFRIYDTGTLRFLARDVAGNWEEEVVSASFEITSTTGGWSDGATVPSPLLNAGVALLNEKVYVVGGSSGQAPQAGGHAYDYIADTWSSLPSLPDGRAQLVLVALAGNLYAIGGEKEGTPRNDISRLQPGVDTAWVARQAMPTTRFGLAAVAYAGKIHVLGGKASGGAVLPTHEIYDPATNSWSNSPPDLPRPRYAFGAVLHEHRIYVVGGEDGSGNPIAELDIFDLQAQTWAQGAPLPTPRSFAGIGLMRNVGEVTGGNTGVIVAGGRIAGGATTAAVEEYVIEENLWRERTPLAAGRHSGPAVRVSAPDVVDTMRNEVWLIGGQGPSGPTGQIVRYSQDQDYVRHLPPLPEGRMMHGAAALDGLIYILGGRNYTQELGGWAFDPETGTYASLPNLATVQSGLSVVALGDLVYAIGGADQFSNAVAHVRAFDPVSGAWLEKQPMLTARRDAAVTIVGNEIYVIGGYNNGALQTVEIYDPSTNTWRSGPTLPAGRTGAMAITHQGDVWLFGGVDGDGLHLEHTRLRLRTGAWNQWTGAGLAYAYGSAIHIGGGEVVGFGGRTPDGLTGRIWNQSISVGQTVVAEPASTSLVHPLDRVAAAYLNGKVYLIGGNATLAVGPAAVSTVQEIEPRCFARTTTTPLPIGCGANHAFWQTGMPAGWINGAPGWARTTGDATVAFASLQSAYTTGTYSYIWTEVTKTFPFGGALEFDWMGHAGAGTNYIIYCENLGSCTTSNYTLRRTVTTTTLAPWQTVRRELQPGTHTFRWAYYQGASYNSLNRGRIDNIRFIHY